jgi:hypothetical protein
VLPAAEQAAAVAHLGIAGHGPDGGVGHPGDEVSDGVGLEDGVAVDHHDDVVAGGGHPGVERCRLPAVGAADQRNPGVVDGLDRGRGAVGGAVVDDDHFQVRVVAGGQ